jgi:hypothetical protein
MALTEGVMKAMLLTKLKITGCFGALMLLAGIGATGLTYRATAQETKQEAGYLAPLASRPQADELEALRLEMEALRKELRATRERVKALEGEMRALKGPMPPGVGGSRQGMVGGMMGMMRGGKGGPHGIGEAGKGDLRPSDPTLRKGGPQQAVDPVADAEAALKKLRQDPTDKQAADELERALKLLKEREKSRPPANVDPIGKR